MAEVTKQEEVKSHVIHSSQRHLLLGASIGVREDVVLHFPMGRRTLRQEVSGTPVPKDVNHHPFIPLPLSSSGQRE